MKNHLLRISLNFFGLLLLSSLLLLPFYFAKNFSQVSGVKSEAKHLIVSQAEKFPGMFFSQNGDRYEISFEKQNNKQAYSSVLVVNNPTSEARTYSLRASSGATMAFFGEDINNPTQEIKVPPKDSVPISLLSEGESLSTQTIEFTIETQ